MKPREEIIAEGRVCLLTPVGRGAVAVVAAEGAMAEEVINACFVARNGKPLGEQKIGAVLYGRWRWEASEEDLVICRRTRARTEIHCHGGVVPSQQLLGAFEKAGCRVESWRTWLRSGETPLEGEAREALSMATTRRTAAVLLDQWQGALSAAVGRLLDDLDRRDDEGASRRLNELTARLSWGLRLTRPSRVVVAGRPNVGKSSLVNALAGYQRAIVMDFPGVTRDALAVDMAIEGWPIELVDVAGVGESKDPLAKEAAETAMDALRQADACLWVLDASQLDDADRRDLTLAARRERSEFFRQSGVSTSDDATLIVANKWDLVTDGETPQGSAAITVSAVTQEGLPALRNALRQRLVPEMPTPRTPVPFTSRQAKWLRLAQEAVSRSDRAAARAALEALRDGALPT